jgi:sialic acid synthase SpsE|tara:strand:+ start:358 stop:1107 length:750 start_codon:yes stop_codon:yes gene_type:complete
MAKLYANISIGHENDWQVLEKRIIAAAQCHSDAIVISKATPDITIPKNKKYVSINSKWGHLPYIDVAKRSEVDELNARKIKNLTEDIGIPIIWSITDTEAGAWVIENTDCRDIKIHFDARNDFDLWKFCEERFEKITVPFGSIIETQKPKLWKLKENVSIYHAAYKMPSPIESLNLDKIEIIKEYSNFIGYEGRSADIYPDCAVELKNVDFIEKYLGDEAGDLGEAVLTPERFYDMFINLNQIEIANGK